jgi:hypothetical protein
VDPDPKHEYANVRTQLAGGGTGFVNDYRSSLHAKYSNLNLQPIMSHFGDGHAGPQLSVLQTLARHFLVCDRWFSSVPGPPGPIVSLFTVERRLVRPKPLRPYRRKSDNARARRTGTMPMRMQDENDAASIPDIAAREEYPSLEMSHGQ